MTHLAPASGEPSIWKRIWRFPLVAMVVALVLAIAAAVAATFIRSLLEGLLDDDALTIATSLLIVGLSLAVYKLAIRHLGTHKRDDLPLDVTAMTHTIAGFAGGGLLITICVALAAAFGTYSIDGWGGFTDWATILFMTGLYAGFFEELLLRGIVFRWLEEFAGSWVALALSSLLFGFLHAGNDNATFFSSLAIAIEAGILLGGAYMLTRSLWLAIGLHAGWNVVQALWDVPVSGNDLDGLANATMAGPPLLAGGGFGLEATIFALVVATGAGAWLIVKAVRKGNVVAPMWRRPAPPAETDQIR